MRSLCYWIQRADFSSTDYDPVILETAAKIFGAYNWARELDLMAKRTASGLDTCPPGIGFVESPGNLLHICPNDSDTAMIHYHRADRARLLGIIPITTNHSVRTNTAVPMREVGEYVRRFFSSDRAWLEANTTNN